jgi:hypothetical protein
MAAVVVPADIQVLVVLAVVAQQSQLVPVVQVVVEYMLVLRALRWAVVEVA